MGIRAVLNSKLATARKRDARWIRLADILRRSSPASAAALFWTMTVHRDALHQITELTWEERYPDLFDLAAQLEPSPARILSFGCSTGEEIISLGRRFPQAEIVGMEINPRSRRIALKRLAHDDRVSIIAPTKVEDDFDLIFALAVLQREPDRVQLLGPEKISTIYPFNKFDQTVAKLVGLLRTGGLLCVAHAHYRVEDSSSAASLVPRAAMATSEGTFDSTGKRVRDALSSTIFQKSDPDCGDVRS